MNIASVMTKVQAYEAAITVTNPLGGSPATLTTRRAYLYIPEKTDAFPECDPIAFFNGYALDYERRLPNAMREQKYTISIQGLVREPSLDKASKIASAFLAGLIDAFDAHEKLEGECTVQSLRGVAPTLTRLEWGGQVCIGLNLLLDVIMRDSGPRGA